LYSSLTGVKSDKYYYENINIIMKTFRDYINLIENAEQGMAEGSEPEGSTFKNSLHTIIRVATHLEKQMGDSENFPEWESEMIGSVKDQMVKIMDYEISKKEQQGVAEGSEPDAIARIEQLASKK
jgi:hypothetical protein